MNDKRKIEIGIEELTKLLIKQHLNDEKNGKEEKIIITKQELFKKAIKVLKMINKS